MKIIDVITTPVLLPFKKSAKWSGGTRRNASALIINLLTDEGLAGWGECVGPTLVYLFLWLPMLLQPLLTIY